MKSIFLLIIIFTSFIGFIECKTSTDPSFWSSKKINTGLRKVNGLMDGLLLLSGIIRVELSMN